MMTLTALPYLLQSLEEDDFNRLFSALTEHTTLKPQERPILCRFCQHPITHHRYKIDIQGQHHHIFHNPAEISFQIGCFSQADGCFCYGVPTLEYTWFAGHYWRYAQCANCHQQLGWYYQAVNQGFFGLILANLRDG
ncbi:hypothetical protein BegalDRAFT_0036 [Beggiatoa alba B18LD]|uniref:CULT domain-containing protein n=1 Tax=Beggiatoa alba B18LD TaxID=395493 RepID=I3CBH0_9GAMM|nr:cereblon family protein [Beggiatoa alba]EIJ40963.1 hypothetical protein BegalDRAFT_0036 [Beggiatoa alba B18LD]